MNAFLPLMAFLFAGPLVVGAVMGAWSWWLPRHRLNVIFKACKRRRQAENVVRLPVVVEPLPSVFELCDGVA